jgi:formylglycine-generating enzyme required for sulfatase activity
MRRYYSVYVGIIVLLISILAGCGGGSGNRGDNNNGPERGSAKAGDLITYNVGGNKLNMHYVPAVNDFPAGMSDIKGASVGTAYFMAETDVTYQLWFAVYDWAHNGNGPNGAGKGLYNFADPGGRGGYSIENQWFTYDSGHDLDPVVAINWRDAMLWCNALTEYYNAMNKTSFDCVYCTADQSTPIRSVNENGTLTTAIGSQDNPYVKETARGFRLPTSYEWELAARYQDGTNWTAGNHASGDATGPCYAPTGSVSTVFGDYAWYDSNSNKTTHQVGLKNPNTLHLYDMSGNVWQWCFDWYTGQNGYRVLRGGSWLYSASSLMIGFVSGSYSNFKSGDLGFRVVRTSQ